MARLGQLPDPPRIAVAVSGGADSLALTLLACDWARARGGDLLAFTVDHRLRPDSAAEAARVGAWLAARGIEHRVLTWDGPKPKHGLQAAARAARYGLLGAACEAAGLPHLLVAHHRDDLAETVALRLQDRSGPDGLAGIADHREMPWGTVLRPLLTVPGRRLRTTLVARAQGWLDDPSNADRRFTRVRLRQDLDDGDRDLLVRASALFAAGRTAFERERRDLFRAACVWHPEGWAEIAPEVWRDADREIRCRALARLLACVGGRSYPPGGPAVARVLDGLGARAATLAGCRLIPGGGRVLVCREARRGVGTLGLGGPGRLLWDGRFDLEVTGRAAGGRWSLGMLGADGWCRVAASGPEMRDGRLPHPVRLSLPALFLDDAPVQVPHLGFDRISQGVPGLRLKDCRHRPRVPLDDPGIFLASGRTGTIS